MESSPVASFEKSNVPVSKRITTAPPPGYLAARTASMFNDAKIGNITGGDFRITNISKDNALKALHKRAAPHAILNAGGRADEVRCHPGTREEVISRIEKWRNAPDSQTFPIFWLSGPAGAGKSAIVQTIAERCNEQKVPQANFFFFRTDLSRNSLHPLLATLIHQIILLYPSQRDPVASLLSTNPLILDSALKDQLMQLVVAPLQAHRQSSPPYHPPLLLIDGLDECESENKHIQQQIIHAFDKVFAEDPCLFRLLVASRDESQIQAAFNGISSPLLPLYLDGQYYPENDIRIFVNDEFKRVRKTHPLAHTLDVTWPSIRDVEGIVQKSSGQFIYAATVMRFIFNSSASPTLSLAMVQGAEPISTKSPFSHLDAIYTFILSRVDDQEALKDILHTQLLAQKYDIHANVGILADIMKAYNFKYSEVIVQSCLAELTSIAQYTEYRGLLFHHASFPDYLLDQSRSNSYSVNLDAFNYKIQLGLWEACRKLSRDSGLGYKYDLKDTASKGLHGLRQLPPGLLNTLMAQDLISVCQFEASRLTPLTLLTHIHSLCACDHDVTNYKRILRQWIYTQPQTYVNRALHTGQPYDSQWPPGSHRYLAMSYIEDHVTTEPHGWIAIALCSETDFDARETAVWLDTLLHRIHRETYNNSTREYNQLLKKWASWATWNDIPLDGVDDLPKARWYLQRSRMEKWAATRLKLGSRPE